MNPESVRNFVQKQATAIGSIAENSEDAVLAAVAVLASAKGKIVVSGVGKSGHVGMKIASTMTSLSVPAVFVHPTEAFHGDLGMIAKDDAVVMLSHSGETKETLRLLQHLKKIGARVVAITGTAGSALARDAHAVLTYRAADEGSPFNLAPMASTTSMMVLGDLLACAVCETRGFTERDFAAAHPGGSLGLRLTSVAELMRTGDDIPTISAAASFKDALKEMNRAKLGIVGIIDGEGRLSGIISDGDVRRFVSSDAFASDAPAAAAMTRDPKTIEAQQSLQAALALMEKHKITVLFALDAERRPVGVVHLHSIVEEKVL